MEDVKGGVHRSFPAVELGDDKRKEESAAQVRRQQARKY
jgi:hypothetical protein